MFTPNGITILDDTMKSGEIRVIRSPAELLGFNIKNEVHQHLFIQPKFDAMGKLIEIIIRTE